MIGTRRLKGKAAVVIGSTSGIGLGMATALAAGGAAIMLSGFGDAGAIDRVRRDLSEKRGVNVSKPAEIRQMIADAASQLGSVNILVNNAGIHFVAPVPMDGG